MSIEALSGKVFLVVTGASRGIGRQIAITFGSLLQESSHILLLARNLNGLKKVAKNIPPKVTVHTVSIDLGEAKVTKTNFEETILGCLSETTRDAFDRVVVVHNVGTIGDVTKFVNEMVDIDVWKQFYTLNLFLPAILNAVIMNLFDSTNIKKVVINITSLNGIQANKACGYYCSAKAAREMYFKVFALENPDVDVLSYAPGHVDTDMLQTVCKTITNPETNKIIQHLHETNTVLTTEQTVNRLVEILKEHKYNAGDHVDYHDK
ncbi:sepiapterin reductase-like [Formica exsecta]|uniref:sepiapterin reductase-like n=2 Tax=Formica exsecta TaxID=72781 RepID=UPI001144C2C6|nr:sepiapterin reductase-like [Formica exsecta]XP_029663599.1 sepiapterin reductase-like [Formica exsecta]